MLDSTVIRKKCRLAISNIIYEGITDVELFTRPFEIDFLKEEDIEKNFVDTISSAILSKEFEKLKLHKISHILVPKKDLCDFRKCAFVDVYDEIVYLTLVLLIVETIERERINRSDERIFSYRFCASKDKSGRIFDSKYHFTAFRKKIEKKTKMQKNKILVECDIANYYDRINIHRIESTLSSFKGIDNDIVKLINDLLLYWANRDSYGLPVGSNASRILAEAALINVDNNLLRHKVDFCRFVDDYRIFAKDAQSAHEQLALLSESLNREGLFVNTSKTRMKDISSKLSIENEITENSEEQATVLDDAALNKGTEPIDVPKIIRGYNGLIPTKFRELSQREKEELASKNLDEILAEIQKSALLEPSEITSLIRIIGAQEKYEHIRHFNELLKKFPQFLPYFVDFVSKRYKAFPERMLDEIKSSFVNWFEKETTPEYILVYLVRLFRIDIVSKDVLLNVFRNLKRARGVYIGRALLEGLGDALTRMEILEIREYYDRADIWEKRQILRIARKLPEGEKQAFFKNAKIRNDDLFVERIASSKMNKK